MKKKFYFILNVFLSASFSIFAQKGVKVDVKSVNKVVKFSPIIKELGKTDFYKFELPTRLTYHNTAEIKGFFPYEFSAIGIKAKLREEQAVYIFEVQSPGISNIKELPNRYYKNGYPSVEGFVKDIQYNFPCNLIVKMWDGKEIKVLRKIEIYSNEVVHSGVYDAGNSVPFATQELLTSSYAQNKNNFYKATERGAMRLAFYRFTQAIDYLFAEFSHGKMPVSIGFVKAKNRDFDFSDIDSLTERYKLAIDAFYEEANPKAAEMLTAVLAEYEKVLSGTDPKIDNNVKDIIKLNMAYCNTLLGNTSKAWESIASLKKSPAVGYYTAKELENFITIYDFRKSVAGK